MIVTRLLNRISRSILLFLFLAIPLLVSAEAQLKINELMPKNVSFLMDKSYVTRLIKNLGTNLIESKTSSWENTYNYSMWVEVYNASTVAKNLSDYYFTDDLSKPKKWKPASFSGVVAAKGYTVLFFEREDEESYNSYKLTKPINGVTAERLYLLNREGHANFKLEPDGGKLYLLNSTLTEVDSVIYPAQNRNVSYGRVADGDGQWAFFEQPSPGTTNSGKLWGTQHCSPPVYTLKDGFYATAQTLRFVMPAVGDTIYYTKDGSEPTRNSSRYVPNTSITLPIGVSKLRAKTFSWGKITSDIVTNTYFIGQRSFNNLPVISIVTDDKNLNDPIIGVYITGTNGIPGNGSDANQNYNQDWDRPVNFEYFDKTGQPQLNQELDISMVGGWSRAHAQKSLAISPKSKFGSSLLNYDFFAASKPGHKYRDIQLRNSGNDFNITQMRDGFIESISANRMDLDYLGYEPGVLFINGTYFGVENIRERSNPDFVFSNHGYAKDDVELLEAVGAGIETKNDIPTDPSFAQLTNFLKTNDLSKPEIYRQVCDSIDIDEYINYMIPEIYCGNNDWPYNNVKMWRKINGGKWRWILYDTDFGFEEGVQSANSLTFALGENSSYPIVGYGSMPEWSYIVFRRLCTSPEFVNKLVDRFAIHMATTYKPARINHVMDSLFTRIDEEMVYHKQKYGGSVNDIINELNNWRDFASKRNTTVMGFVADRFLKDPITQKTPSVDTIFLDANVSGATYTLNNQPIIDKKVTIPYFRGRTASFMANRVEGYRFVNWSFGSDGPLVPTEGDWKYYLNKNMPLKDGVPSTAWSQPDYDDSSWATGMAPLGHGFTVNTTLPYTEKDSLGNLIYYYTAYFRKVFTINKIDEKNNFKLNLDINGGAVIYVNGVDVGHVNISSGLVNYSTRANTADRQQVSISVPSWYFKEGENQISVELHRYYKDIKRFDMSVTCQIPALITEPVFTTTMLGGLHINANYTKQAEVPLAKNIVINEVVSTNQEVMDEFGVKEDYIELYNKGTEPVDIGGWYLTDTPSNKLFHQMPTNNPSVTTLQPGGRLILWADDQAQQGVQHLGFKLGKEGETIILSQVLNDNSVAIMDSVSFPVMGTQSYSRVPDGASTWAIQGLTFNSPNTPTFVPSIENSLIKLYPTQVTESFTVLNADGRMVSVIDLTGKVLKRELCTSNDMTVLTGDLSRGMYIVTVGDKTFKVIRR